MKVILESGVTYKYNIDLCEFSFLISDLTKNSDSSKVKFCFESLSRHKN